MLTQGWAPECLYVKNTNDGLTQCVNERFNAQLTKTLFALKD